MKQRLINIFFTLIITLNALLICPAILNKNSYIFKVWTLFFGGAILLVLLLTNVKKNKLDKKDIIILLFLYLVILSTIFSNNLKISILGQIRNRYEGCLMLFIYVIIYFVAKKKLGYDNKKELLGIIFYIFLLIGIIGITQEFVTKNQNLFENLLKYNKWHPIFGNGVKGTFGNQNFFGSFITIVLPISNFVFLIKGSKKAFLLSQIMFFNLISCVTRSAWVAAILATLLFCTFLVKQKNKTYIKRAFILLIGFIIIASYLFLGFGKVTAKLENTVKADNINKLSSGRIKIWIITLKIIAKKPVLGCGPDNLAEGIMENCPEDFINFLEESKCVIDKAHNEYLQIAATLGIPALILYMYFLYLILSSKIKIIFKDKAIFILSTTIICYLVQAFFNISTIGVAPIFWTLLGLIDNQEIIKMINNDI